MPAARWFWLNRTARRSSRIFCRTASEHFGLNSVKGDHDMARVKRGVTAHAKHKKVLKAAKGFYGRRKNTIRIAKQAVEKSMQYAYRDRKVRKPNFPALWIQRINAAVHEHGLTYGHFIDGLN